MRAQRITVAENANPKGRVDLLLLRIAEHTTGLIEQKIALHIGRRIALWPEIEPLVRREIKQRRIPSRELTISETAELLFSRPKRRRLKCT